MGYLAFDIDTPKVRVHDREAMEAFRESTSGAGWAEVFDSLKALRELLEATGAMDAERVVAPFGESCDRAGTLEFDSA